MPTICSTGFLGKSQLTLSTTNTGILATERSSTDRLPVPSVKYQVVRKQPPTVLRRDTREKKIKDYGSNSPSSKSEADPKQYSITNCKKKACF